MASLIPNREILRRHTAAMTIVQELNPEERILLLGYVVAGTPLLREFEASVPAETHGGGDESLAAVAGVG